MFDITFRPLKDTLFNPLCSLIPSFITPLHITLLAFISGILSCYSASQPPSSSPYNPAATLAPWFLNRALDCLDGALARHRKQASDLGGFLDLLGDFTIYSLIPIACGIAADAQSSSIADSRALWLAISTLEGSFHINNFVLFYIGAILEKRKASSSMIDGRTAKKRQAEEGVKELTSVAMRPALIEGLESGVLFTVMLAFPWWTRSIAWVMAGFVGVGVVQRVVWVAPLLR